MDRLEAMAKRASIDVTTSWIDTAYGRAMKIEGRGAKVAAWLCNSERYLNGETDTDWSRVYPKHGLGYLVPMYENPLDGDKI